MNLQIGDLVLSYDEAEETLRAIRAGKVDAVVVEGAAGHEVFTFRDPSHPYRLLVEAMSEGAALLTLDGILSYCNPRFGALTASPTDELVGQYLRDLVDPADAGRVDALLDAARMQPAREEIKLGRAGSEPVTVQLSVSALILSDVKVLCAVATDLTEHRRQEEAFRRARVEIEGRDRLFSIAAHELRGTLGTLSLQSQFLVTRLRGEAEAAPREKLVSIADALHRQTRQMADLVGKLLDVGTVGSGRLELIPEDVELAALVKEVLERSADLLARSGSGVTVELSPVSGRWDRVRLEQVVSNLVSNAAKYGRGKAIHITLQKDGARARLAVEDQGDGVPDSERERIFRPYERLASTAKSAPGLGLGLYISSEIVKAHGGALRVESAPGGGARFVVELPGALRG